MITLQHKRTLDGMLERSLGVVLHQLRYNDESVIVNIYTQQHGTVSFLVKMPKLKRSNVKTQLLRPLNILELDFDIRPNQNLQRIRDMRLHISYGSLPYDPIKGTVSLFLSEFLYYALKHELENNALFLYLCNSLQWFDRSEKGLANFQAHGQYLDGEESAFLPKLLRMDYATMHLFRFNRQQKSRVLDILVDYYRMHIPEFPELKSLDVLRTVFS